MLSCALAKSVYTVVVFVSQLVVFLASDFYLLFFLSFPPPLLLSSYHSENDYSAEFEYFLYGKVSLHKAKGMTEACDHHYRKRCPILPAVNCCQLADIIDWNNEICALLDVEFCLALRIIVPSKLQPVSYRTLLFALVNSLFEFCLEF